MSTRKSTPTSAVISFLNEVLVNKKACHRQFYIDDWFTRETLTKCVDTKFESAISVMRASMLKLTRHGISFGFFLSKYPNLCQTRKCPKSLAFCWEGWPFYGVSDVWLPWEPVESIREKSLDFSDYFQVAQYDII